MKNPVLVDMGRYRRYGFRLGPDTYHNGHDYDCPVGTPVFAVLSGEVAFSGKVNGFGSMNPPTPGGVVIIRHVDRNGVPFFALYGHIASNLVFGDKVEEGETIGHVISFRNGGALLPHLHFAIYPGEKFPPAPWGYVSKAALASWAPTLKFLKGID